MDHIRRFYYSRWCALWMGLGAVGITAEWMLRACRGSDPLHGWFLWQRVLMLAAVAAYFIDFAACRRGRPLPKTLLPMLVAFWAILAALNVRLA